MVLKAADRRRRPALPTSSHPSFSTSTTLTARARRISKRFFHRFGNSRYFPIVVFILILCLLLLAFQFARFLAEGDDTADFDLKSEHADIARNIKHIQEMLPAGRAQPPPGNEAHANVMPPTVQFAAEGSIAQLEKLLINITQHTHPSRPRFVPASEHVHMKAPTAESVVVTLAVNYAYRDLALNFVCNLRRLHMPNYLVLAMDQSVYDYLLARRVNVFLHVTHSRRTLLASDDTEDIFGSAAFLETSRRKSILVQTVLRLGYTTLFSDVDVIWLKNPIGRMLQHAEDFVLQSDLAYPETRQLNYNLNSGFYLARSNGRTARALRAIVKYAEEIRRSEQKAFNHVLCGAFKNSTGGPGTRLGNDRCRYRRDGATTRVLPLEEFPNGSDPSFWNITAPLEAHANAMVVHANFVQGRAKKVERIQKLGYWFFDEEAASLGKDGCTA